MLVRKARQSDFNHLETFVWQAVFPAFDQEGLSAEQRAENDALVENARNEVMNALDRPHHAVFIALDPKTRSLAGYLIADARPRAYAEIARIIVKRAFWGKDVANELMAAATEFIGRDRAVSLAVRHYNERAIAFFAKHDFVNTGETTGNFAIPRTLLLREAYEEVNQPLIQPAEAPKEDAFFDFPSEADEPVFEALPDYTLSVEDVPLFETGQNALRTDDLEEILPEESSLSDTQLNELEAFIARARAKKGTKASPAKESLGKPALTVKDMAPLVPDQPNAKIPAEKTKPRSGRVPVYDPSTIEFEIDYGAAGLPSTSQSGKPATQMGANKASFEFAFDASASPADGAAEEITEKKDKGVASTEPIRSSVPPPKVLSFTEEDGPVQSLGAKVPTTGTLVSVGALQERIACADCGTDLPITARFCFNCGLPQSVATLIEKEAPGEKAPIDDILLLEDLPEEESDSPPVLTTNGGAESEDATIPSDTNEQEEPSTTTPVTLADLKIAFRHYLQDRLLAYFGKRQLKTYLRCLEASTTFQQVRDGSLRSLTDWINEQPQGHTSVAVQGRKQDTLADLTEYFIVETAAELHKGLFPQRLLRYQSANWTTTDLFQLVMDYLNFEAESERVYTDFVVMPTRALKNATQSFLQAAKDERVFFICDQSLISQAKNGFAVTDSGIYWKNVLQPAGQATFTTMQPPRVDQGHLIIDGLFFDAGGRLNLKIALLLDKLRRMR